MNRIDCYTARKVKTADSSLDWKKTRTWRLLLADAGSEGKPNIAAQDTGKAFVPPIRDEFTIDGPHGTHQCIVTIPARMTVAEAQELKRLRTLGSFNLAWHVQSQRSLYKP